MAAEQLALVHGPRPGPVEMAARTMLDGMLAREELSAEHDGLLVAHVISLAIRLDRPGEKAYGLAAVSRELREVHAILAARRSQSAPAERDPLQALLEDDDE